MSNSMSEHVSLSFPLIALGNTETPMFGYDYVDTAIVLDQTKFDERAGFADRQNGSEPIVVSDSLPLEYDHVDTAMILDHATFGPADSAHAAAPMLAGSSRLGTLMAT